MTSPKTCHEFALGLLILGIVLLMATPSLPASPLDDGPVQLARARVEAPPQVSTADDPATVTAPPPPVADPTETAFLEADDDEANRDEAEALTEATEGSHATERFVVSELRDDVNDWLAQLERLRGMVARRELVGATDLYLALRGRIAAYPALSTRLRPPLDELKGGLELALANEIDYGCQQILQRRANRSHPAQIIASMWWTKSWIDALARLTSDQPSPWVGYGRRTIGAVLTNEIRYGMNRLRAKAREGAPAASRQVSAAWTRQWLKASRRLGLGPTAAALDKMEKELAAIVAAAPVPPAAPPTGSTSRPPASTASSNRGRGLWQNPCPAGRPSPYAGDDGCDFHAPRGTPVYCARDGVIVYNDPRGHSRQETPNDDTGAIRIVHADGKHSWYAHLSARNTALKPGMPVKAGTMIGRVGRANGVDHLHFSIFFTAGGDAGGFMDPFAIAAMFR
ncbi:MAG: hypothetical protein OZSIB_0189 [Candidatus Ozemobacter sibiricus]|uniref:M23ase beta-sheet core domain-containing protein n=1 Tax=Candidatus Ozemobacter sibiricus TaxID=2268124 RepID=A0A367ZMG5_9BACT|nr:MAG: hypothetical protein OZSIB_0189 [Candidatus Ozemobacter sibiricus]